MRLIYAFEFDKVNAELTKVPFQMALIVEIVGNV